MDVRQPGDDPRDTRMCKKTFNRSTTCKFSTAKPRVLYQMIDDGHSETKFAFLSATLYFDGNFNNSGPKSVVSSFN
jgi:hypothetical protein